MTLTEPIRRWLRFGGFSLLTGLVLMAFWWRLKAPPTHRRSPVAATMQDTARYTLEDVTLVRFNAMGEPFYRATADKLRQFPDAAVRLDDFNVTGLGGKESGWTLAAERGDMPPGSHRVTLTPGVVVHGTLEGTGPVTLITETVLLDFDKRTITSRQPVRLSAANHSAEASGGFSTGFDGRALDLDGPVTLFYGGQKMGGTSR